MCGILGYFGDTANSITRVLTGMSAIIYRAPDSTGVGLIGDDSEPIRIRKSLGSVIQLSDVLATSPVYPNASMQLMELWMPDSPEASFKESQRKLILTEDLPTDGIEIVAQKYSSVFTFEDFLKSNIVIFPGWPGSCRPMPTLSINSLKELKETVRDLIRRFDLSFVIIRSLIYNALKKTLEEHQKKELIEVDPIDILNEFDRIYEKIVPGYEQRKPKTLTAQRSYRVQNPEARKYLWHYIKQTPIRIPRDYDRDAIRCIFRLLDAALLSRTTLHPEFDEIIQEIMATHWPGKTIWDWKTLYRAEKGVNVYGRAAAAVFTYLQKLELFPVLWQHSFEEKTPTPAFAPGKIDSVSLSFFSTPTLSQGRWALQAPVSVKNAHPFYDRDKKRIIVLNGQFNTRVEEDTRRFLEKAVGCTFRSDNSSEYLSLLWGSYFDRLSADKKRYESVRIQIEEDIEGQDIGSQTIDYQVFKQVQNKSTVELDELAFREAVRLMAREGGQIATAGMSLYSPRCLYVACHNRPVFIVRRTDNNDVMVVSDINAAMGLFPQSWIYNKTVEYNEMKRRHAKAVAKLESAQTDKAEIEALKAKHKKKENAYLKSFEIMVYPLDGEELFARVETGIRKTHVHRKIVLTDFDGRRLPDIEPFVTWITPVRVKKDPFGSFYDIHLHETPQRMEYILQNYLPEGAELPEFDLRDRYLKRRLGASFRSLNRIILAGMGSAYHMGLSAKALFQTLLPETDVLVIQPTEIDDVSKLIVSEKDVVILLSWSGTTADTVQLAKDLEKHQGMMIGITEKVFADMALIAARSAGLIPVLSGEEITISGIKSTLCTLLCLYLLSAWMSARKNTDLIPSARQVLDELSTIPETMTQMLKDETLLSFCRNMAADSAESYACIVYGDLCRFGDTAEACLKIEENNWTAIGVPRDYTDIYYHKLKSDPNEHFIIVDATRHARLNEAINVMKHLYIADIPFAVITFHNVFASEIEFYSHDRCLFLPKLQDTLQSLINIPFYYIFAHHFARAHGRNPDDFPRNRVKSVTAGRNIRKTTVHNIEWLELERTDSEITEKPDGTAPEMIETYWESHSLFDWDRIYYRQMRKLSAALEENDSMPSLVKNTGTEIDAFAKLLADNLEEEGEIIFIPFDRIADFAAKTTVHILNRYSKATIRVISREDPFHQFSEDAVFILVASKEHDGTLLKGIEDTPGKFIWIGPPISNQTVADHLWMSVVPWEDFAFIEGESLYAIMISMFIQGWKIKHPEKASFLENHLRRSRILVEKILNHLPLKEQILDAMEENRKYRSAFYLGPPGGTGSSWMRIFDQAGSMVLQWHPFGASAHGPLAAIDDRVDEKYVRITERNQMVEAYGKDRVLAWEKRFLKGERFDRFLSRTSGDLTFLHAESPFFAEESWYLPALREDYDARSDNLIIIDAASDKHFGQAQDELSTYGCRNARMIVISQEAYRYNSEKKVLNRHPLSNLILLPSFLGKQSPVPIPDLLLPFAMNLIGIAMASAASFTRSLSFTPATEETILTRTFGLIGKIILRYRMDVYYLSQHLIESLKFTAPLIEEIEGSARYSVKRIDSEAELHALYRNRLLYNADQTIENYKLYPENAFYLVRPEPETFEGKAQANIQKAFEGDHGKMWCEPYGNTWKVLYHRILGLQEYPESDLRKAPTFQIPFVDPQHKDGWLINLNIRYMEWRHRVSLGEEIKLTVKALGKEMSFHKYINSRYIKIVNQFNDEMFLRGYMWDDRILALISRKWLFQKQSMEIVSLLTQRVLRLADIASPETGKNFVDTVARALETIWPNLTTIENLSDLHRWENLFEALSVEVAKD